VIAAVSILKHAAKIRELEAARTRAIAAATARFGKSGGGGDCGADGGAFGEIHRELACQQRACSVIARRAALRSSAARRM